VVRAQGTASVFARRRAAVLDAIGDAVAIFPSAPVFLRNNDVEHEYRQDSDLYWLTGFDEPRSVCVLDGRARTFTLFVRPRDATRETWDGSRAGVDGACSVFGADDAFAIEQWPERLPDFLARRRLYYRLGRDRTFDDRILSSLDAARSRARLGLAYPVEIVDPSTVVHEMRRRKDETEVAAMRRAAAITGDAHVAAMRMARAGRFEHEVEGLLRNVFRSGGAARCAYQPIVAGGRNATVLHYRKNAAELIPGSLLLIDAGCEYGFYASDVTRTFPVSGRFSTAQREVYELVLEAQMAAIAAAGPGKTVDEVHAAAVEVLTAGLHRLGVLSRDAEPDAYRRFYMHRTSHYLGMDVHDVGAYFVDGAARPLDPGVVITVEPGLYFGDDPSVPEAYRGIGVRIEDDVLVTDAGHDVLTAAIPKTVTDVELLTAS